ncbi:MAG: hypothetical protein J6T34_03520 [Bacilli bacterium]|nr:hypothetical protein [Bacilli bacterium]
MKRTFLRNFKQVYRDKATKEEKEYRYQVTIVRDTENYLYRILNVTEGTLWKNISFKTMDDALLYLEKHPHAIKDDIREVALRQFY